MKISVLLSFGICILMATAQAQTDKIVLVNTQKVGADRYRDIRGTPFYFEDWHAANILSGSGETYFQEEVNYNGYTQNFEIRKGDEYIELDAKWYLQVEFTQEDNPDSEELAEELGDASRIVFQKRGQANFEDRWMVVLFKGDTYTLLKEFDVAKEKKVFQNVGKEVVVERFNSSDNYYVVKDNEFVRLKSNKKKLLASLGQVKEAEKLIKAEKLDLKTDSGMRALISFYDNL